MNDRTGKCECSFAIRMLGDGCRYCQPQEYIDRLHDTMQDMVHVESLSDEEIIGLVQQIKYSKLSIAVNDFYILLARAIEERILGK